MKKFILIFSCLLLFVVNINAQVTNKMNFQMLVRDAAGELLADSTIGIQFQIEQNGSILFEENHSTSTNPLGMGNVKIGGGNITIGTNLNAIDWSDGPYLIHVGVDPLGGTSYTLQNTSELNSVPLASSTLKSAMALTADYNSLTNLPITITTNQISLLGFLTLTNALDLDAIKVAVDLNTIKSFPGFGITAGTAFEILWSKIGNNAFYENGNVGIGTSSSLNTSAAALKVEGGVLYETTTAIETEIGALKYLDIGTATLNDFYYGNNIGTFTLLNSIPNKDIVFTTDANVISKLGIGENIKPSYNFGDNNFVISDSTPSIRFEDTSASASFPSADWRIKINDEVDFGDSYFSVENFNTGDSNFKMMAGAPTNAFHILENGNVGINMLTPSAKMEISNTVMATGFVGDASSLTNLPLGGTANTSNLGSTTIIADNDSNSIGAIIFQSQGQNQMSIASNGNVVIGNIIPSTTLEVDGNFIAGNIQMESLILNGHLKKPITIETPVNFTSFDIADKSVVVMNPTTAIALFGFLNGFEGQEVTFINSGTGTVSFYPGAILTPGGALVALEQNETMTIVKNGGNFLIVNLVN